MKLLDNNSFGEHDVFFLHHYRYNHTDNFSFIGFLLPSEDQEKVFQQFVSAEIQKRNWARGLKFLLMLKDRRFKNKTVKKKFRHIDSLHYSYSLRYSEMVLRVSFKSI